MPVIIAALIGGLMQAAGSLVGRVLLSLGIGFATFTAVDTSIGWAKARAVSQLSTLPADALGLLSAFGVGTMISMISSAYVVRMTMQGLTGGTVRKMVGK